VVQYYVHYVDYNKRLDEWVTEDRLDTRKIEPPQVAVLWRPVAEPLFIILRFYADVLFMFC
jgi:hypothetical protein